MGFKRADWCVFALCCLFTSPTAGAAEIPAEQQALLLLKVLAYDRILTRRERVAVRAYLDSKYGL